MHRSRSPFQPHAWIARIRDLLAAVELRRLRRLPRYKRFQSRILGPSLVGVDGPSCYAAFGEIFRKRYYEFASASAEPRIIDGGANIGLSVIFFKRLFPRARVTAFEPDPDVFSALAKNMQSFGLGDVDLVNKALWIREETLDFHQDGADGGRLNVAQEHGRSLRVQTLRLHSYLSEPVDMLKLDIEGAEVDVLLDCADRLGNVRHCYVEYHSFMDRPQRLDELLGVLRGAGFRVQLHTQFRSPQPMLARQSTLGMDFQMDIAAYREGGPGA
jgi:FkbM family methyltransferase